MWNFLISILALIAPPPDFPPGNLRWQGSVLLRQVKDTEITNQASKVRELKSAGYSCVHVTQGNYSCSKLLKPDHLPEVVADSIRRKHLSGIQLAFAASTEPPQLLFSGQGDQHQEWKVFQPTALNEKTYLYYRLQISPSIRKLVFDDQYGKLEWSFVIADRELILFDQVRISRENGWTLYSVDLGLAR